MSKITEGNFGTMPYKLPTKDKQNAQKTMDHLRQMIQKRKKDEQDKYDNPAMKKEEVTPSVDGAIPNPISKKYLKKASANQPLTKEEVAGFADASAPSNSNYQTELSPTKTAKSKNMKKKTVKETYVRRMVELMDICPACNNTGMIQKFGNNMICNQCTAGEDKRVEKENEMYKQARDMLTVGKTTAVAEDVIHSVDDVAHILEDYKPSRESLARTKYLVQPNLSRMLRDRLAARQAAKAAKSSKGSTPSRGTMGLAAARKAQMSKVSESTEPYKAGQKVTVDGKRGEISHVKVSHDPAYPHNYKITDVDANDPYKQKRLEGGNFIPHNRVKPITEAKKKPNLSAHTSGKALSSLSAKPMMGSANDNRMSEHVVLTFSPQTAVYAAHHHTCSAADSKKTNRLEEKFNSVKEARQWADQDESDKAGEPTKARFKACACSANIKEQTLTEISKRTLTSYIRRSTIDAKDHSYNAGMNAMTRNTDKHRSELEKGSKRYMGISNAVHKLAGYSKVKPTAEETVNEVSKKTLGSYIKKATDDVSFHSFSAGSESPKKTALAHDKKAFKRQSGIAKATDKLTKEEFLVDGEMKKAAGAPKSGLKRKYLGAMRGRTATGKPAHAIEVDPVLKADSNLNKMVK